MTDLILHQYALSPYSKKVISIFAFKNLAWQAVEQPVIAPKPDLTPLTGGYRKIPVLQIGAHIYCDTKLMIREIEKRYPDTPLTPPALLGAAECLPIGPIIGFSRTRLRRYFEIGELVPKDFLVDRAAMQRPEVLAAALPVDHVKAQFVLDLQMINRQLEATPFMLGERFTLADAATFHVLNFACSAPSLAAEVNKHPAIAKWLKGILDMGEGQRSDMQPPTRWPLHVMQCPITRHRPMQLKMRLCRSGR